MDGVTCWTGWIWCCRGEVSGEPLESDDRSEEAEWMECNCEAETVNQLLYDMLSNFQRWKASGA